MTSNRPIRHSWKSAALAASLALASLAAGNALAASGPCGSLANAYGPYDYADADQRANKLPIVEGAHFTEDVEEGIRGATGLIGGDMDYTLRAFPNHHRALAAMARLSLRTKAVQIPGAKYPVECYFERAIRFRPNDGAVHGEYGNYLYALQKNDRAMVEFKQAVALEPDNATINYNLGLAYYKDKNYDQAYLYAKNAYALGFPLDWLKGKLVEAGKWTKGDDQYVAEKRAAKQKAANPDDKAATPDSNSGIGPAATDKPQAK